MADGARPDIEFGTARASQTVPVPSLVPDEIAGYVYALIVGAIGAVIFVRFSMPLPWFLGSLTACLVASVLKLPVRRPRPLSVPMRAILGVAVGSAFAPALLGRMGSMVGSLMLLVPYMIVIVVIGMYFYERLAGFDRPTAFYSAVPGGLTDMTTMAEDSGANTRSIVLTQATRIVIIVFALPLWLQWHDGITISATAASRVRLADISPGDAVVLFSIGLGGWLTARSLGLAGAPIVGPMVASGLVHAFGLTEVRMPLEVLTFAQIGVGAMLGCQFRGLTWREFKTTMIWGIAFSLVLLAIIPIVVLGVSRMTGFDPISVLLAFAPGGQTELNLLAYILGLDVAYVALHHLTRLAIVIFGAQIVFKTKLDWRKASA